MRNSWFLFSGKLEHGMAKFKLFQAEEIPITFQSQGAQLVGMHHKVDSDKIIILCHGFTGSKSESKRLFVEAARDFASRGFNALRFDFYGSGESPGEMRDKTVNILEQNAKDSLEFIVKDPRIDSNRMGIWGRSLGGTLACLLPQDSGIKARVAASPGILFEKTMKEKFTMLRKKELDLEKEGKKLPGTGDYKGPFDFRKEWFGSLDGFDRRVRDNLKNLSAVLVLGTALDQKVTAENACIVMNSVKEPKRIWIFDTDHDFAGFEDEAVAESVDWFNMHLKYSC